MDIIDLMQKGYRKTITAKELEYYKQHCMSECEKKIGKPIFQMTNKEYEEWQVLEYNNSKGNMTDYDCPICKNKGNFLYINSQGYKMYGTCECMAVRNSLRRLKNSGLDNLLDIYTFGRYKTDYDWQRSVVKTAYDFIDSKGIGFVILGQSGSGKTHICTALSKELMLKGMDLLYMSWITEATKLKQNKMNPEIYEKEIQKLQNIEVLYIDDLFKGCNGDSKPTPADINLAMEIINYRYNLSRSNEQRMITIISSEKTISELREIDEALTGRIKEMAGEWIITLSGKDKNYRFKEN